jgi:hypothetical protein
LYICSSILLKRVFILTALILGFASSPIEAFACGNDAETACCSSNSSESKDLCSVSGEKKSCCAESDDSKEGENTCDNSCNNNSCHCPNGNINIHSPFIESDQLDINAIENNKQDFYPIQIHVSSGFLSIWCPPKIS